MSPSMPDPQTQMRLRVLSVSLREHGICVLHQDNDHRFDFAENLPATWPERTLIGSTVETLPEGLISDFTAAYARCRQDAENQRIDFELGDGLRKRQFDIQLMPDETGVTTIVTDVTDERARDVAMASLLREVSHRSKNLLAIVQSIAMQTAHHGGDVQDFLSKFRGRLHALSGTQDLVTESNWRGTYLQSLITSQLVRLGPRALGNVRVTGENPLLGPNSSLHIGLAMHELGVNATLHGGLSNGQNGHIWIDARLVDEPGQPRDLVIEWQETGIDDNHVRHPPHFGTLVLERIVPLSVGGTAEYTIESGSVRYRLRVPADQFDA